MRNGTIRFPVRTNGNTSESASEAWFLGLAKPRIPTRSQFRVTLGQNHLMQRSGLRRSGLSPINIGNERNRSNSGSILQATQNDRSKRMGMVPKEEERTPTLVTKLRFAQEPREQPSSIYSCGPPTVAFKPRPRIPGGLSGQNGCGNHLTPPATRANGRPEPEFSRRLRREIQTNTLELSKNEVRRCTALEVNTEDVQSIEQIT
ncbi:MAG: hypothetical protein Q9170_002409 [Blastenia crenularia]